MDGRWTSNLANEVRLLIDAPTWKVTWLWSQLRLLNDKCQLIAGIQFDSGAFLHMSL